MASRYNLAAISSYNIKNFIQKPVNGGIPAIENNTKADKTADKPDGLSRRNSDT